MGMTWNLLSDSDLHAVVQRILTSTIFEGHTLPAPLLELRITHVFYIGFGCQLGYNREREYMRQIIQERRDADTGRVISQPALRKMDESLLEEEYLHALGFRVCILHEDLLAVNGRRVETGIHRKVFEGPLNKNRLYSHRGGGSYYDTPDVIKKHAADGRASQVFLTYASLANLEGKMRFNPNLCYTCRCRPTFENQENETF